MGEAISKATSDLKTTILGVLLALLTYLSTVGGKLPTTRDEWFVFIVGCGLALVGFLLKDSAIGLGKKEPPNGGAAGPGA